MAEKGTKRGTKAVIAKKKEKNKKGKNVSHPIKQLYSKSVKQTKNIYNLS